MIYLRRGNDSRFFTLAVQHSTLRNLLLQELGLAAVTWNSRCAGYGTDNGRPFVLLEGGAKYGADVVVACDGVHSVIRKQMLGDPPRFLGLTSLDVHFINSQPVCLVCACTVAADRGAAQTKGLGYRTLLALVVADGGSG